MSRLSLKVVAYLVAALFLAAMWENPAQAKNYTLTVAGTSDGVTERSIGATEGCTRFNIADLKDIGLRNYRIWLGMSRLEPEDDDGVYGSPNIDKIKANPNEINWAVWDYQLNRTDSYHWSSGCSPSEPKSLFRMLSDLRDEGITAVVTLRNVDDNGEPAWAAQLNPPETQIDWNEWWEHVFATVYYFNVIKKLEVHDWQVHNEPDSVKQGWGGSPEDYIEFVRKTHDAIKYVYDTYINNSPEHEHKTFRLYAPVTTGVNDWVKQSLLQNDHVIDVVDWHNYSSSHYASAVEVNEWIDLYDSDGKHEDTYISEWGSYRSAYGFSNALSYAKILIEHSRDNAGYVTGSAIFPFYDWQTMGGIVHGDGTKTPTYYALRLMIRGLQGGKTRYPISHNIPSTVDIQSIAAAEGGSLYVEVVNRTRMEHAITLDANALVSSGPVSFWQFSDGVNDVQIAPGALSGGKVNFRLPALSIIQAKLPLANPPPTEPPAYVSNIVMSTLKQGKNYRASASVSIADTDGNPLSGATVEGTFSGATTDSVSGVTDGSGQVTLNSSSTRQAALPWYFCVSVVRRDGLLYEPSANAETCDSIPKQ